MKAATRRALLLDLELIRTRLRSGLTLTQATRDLDARRVSVSEDFTNEWRLLCRSVLDGRASAGESLDALHARLRSEDELESQIARCTVQPRSQGWLVSGLTLLFGFYQTFLGSPLLRASPAAWLIAVPLLATGLLSLHLLAVRVRRHLWVADWIHFLRRLENGLAWGESLPTRLMSCEPASSWPRELAHNYQRVRERIRRSEPPAIISHRARGETRIALETLGWIERLFYEGHPQRELLRGAIASASESLSDCVLLAAERLKLQMLAPLFLFFLPGFAAFLVEPLLRVLRH